MQTQHECTDTVQRGWDVLSACPGEGLGAGATVGLVVGLLLVLGAIGFGIWWVVRRMREA